MIKNNAEIVDGSFTNNTATTQSGGAICTSGNLMLKNSSITGNYAKINGGGIEFSDGRFGYDNITVNGNTAGGSGNNYYPDITNNIDWTKDESLNLTQIDLSLIKKYKRGSDVNNNVMQGMTVTDKYIVFAQMTSATGYTHINIADKNSGTLLRTVSDYKFEHANALAYDPKTDTCYILYKLNSKNYITSFKINSSYQLTNVQHHEISNSYFGLAYNYDDDYFITISGNKMYKLDKNFNQIEVMFTANTNLTKQDIAYCNGRVYYTCYEAGEKWDYQTYFNSKEKNSNLIYVYKLDGTLEQTLYIPYYLIEGEIEGVHVEPDGKLYTNLNVDDWTSLAIYSTQLIYKVEEIKLNQSNYTFTNSTPLQLEATVLPENATNKEVEWTSSNTSVATVDSTGKVTPKSNGTCKITAKSKDGSEKTATCDITVNIPIQVTSVTLNKTSYTFTNSTPLQLNATVKPDNATNKEVEWTSSNTSVATVDSTGKVTPKSNGTCKITAKSKDGSEKTATCDITVNIPIIVTSVTLNKTSYTFTDGTPLQLNATVKPDNATNKEVEWTSSNTSVATVDSTGKVTPKSNGTCKITAKSKDGSEKTATCDITVNIPIQVTSVTLNKTSYTFTNSTPLQLKATVLPENATNKEVTWESTNPGNLVVDQTGKVTVTSNSGSGMIIARAKDGSGKTAICNITIDIPTKYISLNKSEYTLNGIGESVNLKATISPSSMSQEVNWISSNTSVATVDNSGKVTSVGVGTSIITATSTQDSSLKASCNVTVQEVRVTSITLNKTSYTFTNTTPLQLTATVLPENAVNKEVEWTTTNPSNIVVDQTGKVMVTSNKGSGMIIARAKDGSGVTAICNITVNIGGSTYKKGDINKDGKVNVNDLNYGLRGLTRNTLTEEEMKIGDVNGDNKFNVNDLNKMLRYLVGKIKTLD